MKYVCAIAISLLSAAPMLAAPVVVTNSNPGNWAFDTRDASGSVVLTTGPNAQTNYVNGPATPPLGTGSAHLSTPNGTGDGAAELRNTGYAGVRLDALTSLSYSTYMATNNGQQFPYLGLMVSEDGTSTSPDDILFFEPPYQTPGTGNPSLPNQGGTAMNTWQTWNALEGGWWDNQGDMTQGTGVNSLSHYLGLHPNATIENAGSGLGGVRFDVGFASPGDTFDGNVDNFTIGVNGQDTTFNFEAETAAPLPSVAACGFALIAGVGVFYRFRRATHAQC